MATIHSGPDAQIEISGGVTNVPHLITTDSGGASDTGYVYIRGLRGAITRMDLIDLWKINLTDLLLHEPLQISHTLGDDIITIDGTRAETHLNNIHLGAPGIIGPGTDFTLMKILNVDAAIINGLHASDDELSLLTPLVGDVLEIDSTATNTRLHRITSDGVENGSLIVDNSASTITEDHGSGGGATTLDDLTDVNAPTPADDDVLTWDSGTSTWVPAAGGGGGATTLDALTDVDTTGVTDGQVLVYDDIGAEWVPATIVGAGSDLDDINDVNAPTPSDGDVLTFDTGTGEWVNAAPTGGGGSGLYAPASPHADNDEFAYADATDPTTEGWTWGNQTGATASIEAQKLVIRQDNTASRNFRGLFKAFPASGDVSFVAAMGSTQHSNHWGFGIMVIYGTLATPTRIEYLQARNDHASLDWRTMTGWADTGAADRIAGGTSGRHMWYYGGSWGFKFNASTFALQSIWSPELNPPSNGFRPYGAAITPVASTRPDFYGFAVNDSTTNPAGTPLASWAEFFRVNWAT